jgi:uncharacterized protein YeaO (DUF488 family)
METLEEKIARVVGEEVAVEPYNPCYPMMFEQERPHLLSCLPHDLIQRIEHFGGTAIPGLSAKPIVDILIEVTSLNETKKRIVPILDAQGYDIWLPNVAPTSDLVKLGRAAESEKDWTALVKKYRAEMADPEKGRILDLLAALSHDTNFSVGCYCENEARCHRSILRELLAQRGAELERVLVW